MVGFFYAFDIVLLTSYFFAIITFPTPKSHELKIILKLKFSGGPLWKENYI